MWENLMRKSIAIVLVLVLTLSVVAIPAAAQSEEAWECPDGYEGQTLQLFNWADYIADDTVSNFEEACGVTIEYSVFGTNDQLLTTLQAGNAAYDIVVPSITQIPNFAELGLIQPLDHSLIPNIADLTVIIPDMPIDPNNEYSAPYQWGTIGIAYDNTIVDTPITSWDDFFAYDGRVAWLNDSQIFLKIALIKLGYPYSSLDEAQIHEAADYLLTVPQSDIFAITDNEQADLLLRGEVDAIIVQSRGAANVISECECDDFTYVLPSDGFIPYSDVLAIPANAPNPALANVFIDYILNPQVNADLSNALGSASFLMDSQMLIDEDIMNNGVSYVPIPELPQFRESRIIIEEIGQTTPIYNDEWNRIRAELSGG